jgi:tetratricopeptide (TPR) repeat protein
MIPVPESIKVTDPHLMAYLSSIEHAVSDLWKIPILQNYTDHSITHSERIIKALGKLLEKYGPSLNDYERFILLASAYLHDIGMQSPVHAGLGKKERYSKDEEQKIRDRHNETSAKMIVDTKLRLGLENCLRIAPFVAKVCKYHRDLDLGELDDTSFAGEKIRIPLLAGLLRLSDELDADQRRIIMEVLKTKDIPLESKYHWWAHHYVQSVNIENEIITLYFQFPLKYKGSKLIGAMKGKIETSVRDQYLKVFDLFERYGLRLYRDINCIEDYAEIGLEDIPKDLEDYITQNVIRLEDNSALISKRNGVDVWIEGVPFSDSIHVVRCLNNIFQYLAEEKIREAIREVERCRCFTMGPMERIAFCTAAGIAYFFSGDTFRSRVSFEDALSVSRRSDMREIFKVESKLAESSALGNIGLVYLNSGNLDNALNNLLAALEISKEIGSRQGEASDLGNIGMVYRSKGVPDQALKFLQASFQIHEEIGFSEHEVNSLNNIGLVHQDMGNVDLALDYYRNALKISKEIGFRQGEANALGNMGVVYESKGDVYGSDGKRVLKYYQDALRIFQEMGLRHGEADALGNIGSFYLRKGKLEQAMKSLQDALKICEEICCRQGVISNLNNIGLIFRSKCRPDEALDYFQAALEISREIGFRQGEANVQGNIGLVYQDNKDLDNAINHFQAALEISKEIGFRQGEAIQLGNIGLIHLAKRDMDRSLEYLQSSLKIHTDIQNDNGRATQLSNIGIIYRAKGDLDSAIKSFQEALKIYQEMEFREGEASQLGNIGCTFRAKGDPIFALKNLQEALRIHQEIGSRQGEALDLNNIKLIYRHKGAS